jgi:hypothetical protein
MYEKICDAGTDNCVGTADDLGSGNHITGILSVLMTVEVVTRSPALS